MIKCYVSSCDKLLKNKLAVSHHIKMSAINCLEHKKYLEELKSLIGHDFEKFAHSSVEVGAKYNVGPSYVQQIWNKKFSKEQLKERRKKRLILLNEKKFKETSKIIICKHCKKTLEIRKNEQRVFCSNSCFKQYKKEHCEEFSFNKGKSLEEIQGVERAQETRKKMSETNRKRNPLSEIVCFRCKTKKVITVNRKKKILKTLNKKRYFCSACKAIRKHEQKTKAYKCGHCKKPIRRLLSEKNKRFL